MIKIPKHDFVFNSVPSHITEIEVNLFLITATVAAQHKDLTYTRKIYLLLWLLAHASFTENTLKLQY